MANISSAFGTITITAEGKAKKLEWLIKETIGTAYYYTELGDLEGDKDKLEGNFCGCGRWAFTTNCEMFYEWIKHDVENSDRQEVKEVWEELNDSDWEVMFDFKDEEGGMGVLYTAVCSVKHTKGSNTTEYNVYEIKDYDYAPENLVDLGVCENLSDAYEYMGIEEDD